MMRKKINISELKLGMYIDELCGSWMDHPFWKTSFKLEELYERNKWMRLPFRLITAVT